MSHERCWGLNGKGQRCVSPAMPGRYFCQRHWGLTGPHTFDVFCLPEAEMPPELAQYLRQKSWSFVFPAPQPVAPPLNARITRTAPVSSQASERESNQRCADPEMPSAPPTIPTEPATASLGWMLTMLQQVMEDVAAGTATPLQKASVLTRLGNLYLKTYRAADLQRENKTLARRVAEMEKALAAAAVGAADGGTAEATVVLPLSRPPAAGRCRTAGSPASTFLSVPAASAPAASVGRFGSMPNTPHRTGAAASAPRRNG
jgi:hypothetical protein